MQILKLSQLDANLKLCANYESLEATKHQDQITTRSFKCTVGGVKGDQSSLRLKQTNHIKVRFAGQTKLDQVGAPKKHFDVRLGFKLRESSFKVLLLWALVSISGLLRYISVLSAMQPVLYSLEAANLNVALYNYMMLQDRALLDAIGWSDTNLILNKKPSEVFWAISDKVKTIAERILVNYRAKRVGANSEIYRHLMETHMCDILAKTLEDMNPSYPNCDVAMAGIVNKTFVSFIDNYLHVKNQIMSQWSREPTLEAKRNVLYRQETVSFLGYLTINTFGTTDAIYYHFMYPLVAILDGTVQDLLKALNIANVLTCTIGIFSIISGIALQIMIFRKDYFRFMRMIYIIPTALLISNPKLRLQLDQAIKYSKKRLDL
jgi:hypothetical protein